MGLVHIPLFEQRAGQAKTGQVADSQDWSEDGLLLTDVHGVYRWVILRQMEMTYSLRSCLEPRTVSWIQAACASGDQRCV